MAQFRTHILPWQGATDDLAGLLWLVGSKCHHVPLPEDPALKEILGEAALPQGEEETLIQHLEGTQAALNLDPSLSHRSLWSLHAANPNIDALIARFDQFHTLPGTEAYWLLDGEGIFGLMGPDGLQLEVHLTPGDCLLLPGSVQRYFYPTATRRVKLLVHRAGDGAWAPVYCDGTPLPR